MTAEINLQVLGEQIAAGLTAIDARFAQVHETLALNLAVVLEALKAPR